VGALAQSDGLSGGTCDHEQVWRYILLFIANYVRVILSLGRHAWHAEPQH